MWADPNNVAGMHFKNYVSLLAGVDPSCAGQYGWVCTQDDSAAILGLAYLITNDRRRRRGQPR